MKTEIIIFDSEANSLYPGDCVIHNDGRSGRLIYSPRSNTHRVIFDDKSEIQAVHMQKLPVIKVSLAWKVSQVAREYFGLRIHLPNTAKFIAIDSFGHVYGFLTEPKIQGNYWRSEFPSYYLGEMTMNNLPWEKSLVKIG